MIRPLYEHLRPTDWIELPLQEVVTLKRGYSWAKEQETTSHEVGAIPVIRIPNIQSRLDLSELLYLRDVTEDKLRESSVTAGWVLFVGSNGNPNRIGDSVHIDLDLQMVFASFLMAMSPKDHTQLDSRFLAYWLKMHNVHEWFSKTSQRTSGLANFSWSAARKLPIRLPSVLAEQRAIVTILNSMDKLIELTSLQTKFMREIKSLEDAIED